MIRFISIYYYMDVFEVGSISNVLIAGFSDIDIPPIF